MNRFCFAHVAVALVLALSPGLSRVAAAETDAKKFDPEAEKILHHVSEFYVGLKSLKVDVTVSKLLQNAGMEQKMANGCAIAAQRPNKISFVASGPDKQMQASLVSDGTKIYTCIAGLKQYVAKDAPADFDVMLDGKDAGMSTAMMRGLFIDMLLQGNPYDLIVKDIDSLKAAGTEDLDGVKCHHLKFTQEQVNLDLWVEAATQPVVRKLVVDMSQAAAASRGGTLSKDFKMEMTVAFANWSVNQELPAGAFTFTPPAGAKQVASFTSSGEMRQVRCWANPHPDSVCRWLAAAR